MNQIGDAEAANWHKVYQTTMDEIVEANVRLHDMTGLTRQTKRTLLTLPPVIAVLMGVLIFDPWTKGLWIGVGVAVFVVVCLLLTMQHLYRHLIRRSLKKVLGGDGPVPSEYKITDSSLVHRRPGHEMHFLWSAVQSVTRTDDALEVFVKPPGLARIPTRIFDDAAEIVAWQAMLEERVAASRSGAPGRAVD